MSARKGVTASRRKGLPQVIFDEKRSSVGDSVVRQPRSPSEGWQESAPLKKIEKTGQVQISATAQRMIRESVSMPVQERQILDDLVKLLRKRGVYEVTRSQLLRAGIAKLASLEAPQLEEAIALVERGRPGRKPSDPTTT